ncbi:endonuclease dU [Halobellus captivus]|uniref:endonuclease dU n=1 Tax=Halobellus captivus TaxID=2592614 RepID=UPI00119EC363|nr:DUF99 family protein [Halobellus captivus]
MKPGTRALGIAESTDERSGRCVFCGAVVRADRVVDGVAFATASVGGLDATDAVCTLFERLQREDVRYLLVSGVAPAWFNLLDLDRIAASTERPVLSVSFEESPGLNPALREQFDGEGLDDRLGIYERLPPRRRLRVNDERLFVRYIGFDDGEPDTDAASDAASDDDGVPEEITRVVRAYTPVGGRPEPIRVARLAARAARQWRAEPFKNTDRSE